MAYFFCCSSSLSRVLFGYASRKGTTTPNKVRTKLEQNPNKTKKCKKEKNIKKICYGYYTSRRKLPEKNRRLYNL